MGGVLDWLFSLPGAYPELRLDLLARLLLAHGEIRPEDLAAALLAWSQTPRVAENHFVGPSTRKVLVAMQSGVALDKLPRQGTSVGAAMRTAPVIRSWTTTVTRPEGSKASASRSMRGA